MVLTYILFQNEHAVAQFTEASRYETEGRGFDSVMLHVCDHKHI